jgi:hypothetical protein
MLRFSQIEKTLTGSQLKETGRAALDRTAEGGCPHIEHLGAPHNVRRDTQETALACSKGPYIEPL